MLRIDIRTEPTAVTLQLEGELTGVWVCELFDAWRTALPTLNGRALRIDLTDVVRVDKAGEYLLAPMRCNGARLTGAGGAMRDLIRTIARNWPIISQKFHQEA